MVRTAPSAPACCRRHYNEQRTRPRAVRDAPPGARCHPRGNNRRLRSPHAASTAGSPPAVVAPTTRLPRQPSPWARCAWSTATATSTPSASRPMSTSSSVARAWRGSSGFSFRAGMWPRAGAPWRSPIGSTGWTWRSASTRTTRTRSTTRPGPTIAALGRRPPGRRDRRDRPRLRPGLQPDPDQLANLRRNLALALETGKPAILHCRSARRAARRRRTPWSASSAPPGVGGAAWAAAFGERPPAIIHSYSGPLDYASDRDRPGARGQLLRPRLPAAARKPPLQLPGSSPTSACWSRPIRRSCRRRARPRRRNEPEWVAVTARWVASRAEPWTRSRTPDGASTEALGGRLDDAGSHRRVDSRDPRFGSLPLALTPREC